MELSKKLKEMEKVVEELFLVNDKPYLLYHNINHTRNVVKRAQEIAGEYKLSEEELFVLQAAAWFHDTGHLFSNMAQHEEMGVQIMRIYLGDRLEEQMLLNIGNCILATNIKVKPVSLIEEILRDADTYHFGTPEFQITDPLVWREMEKRSGKIFEKKAEKSLHLLELHTFYTHYCITLLTKGKQDNIAWLKQKIAGSDE